MANSDSPQSIGRPTGGARAYRTPPRPGNDEPVEVEGERGMSSVAMRARKARPERKSKREPRAKEKPAAEQKPEQNEPSDEGEKAIRKGIYLSALIWVEGDWPAARDFMGPAKAAAKDALGRALEGEHDGLTLRLKGLEVRNDVEDDGDDGESESEAAGKKEDKEKFEF